MAVLKRLTCTHIQHSHTEEKVVCRVSRASRLLQLSIEGNLTRRLLKSHENEWTWTSGKQLQTCLKHAYTTRTVYPGLRPWDFSLDMKNNNKKKQCYSFEFMENWTCVGHVRPVVVESLLGCECNMKQQPTSTRSLRIYLFIEKGEWKKRCDAGENNKSCLSSKKAWAMIYAFMTVSMYLCSVTLVSTDRWLHREYPDENT